MKENKVFNFKLLYAKFLKVDSWMKERRLASDPKAPSWKENVEKFFTNHVSALEKAWSKLKDTEKTDFSKQMGWEARNENKN